MTLESATGYDTVPLNIIDSNPATQRFVVTYCLIVDGVLDTDKLKLSLERLITDKWRILGARLTKHPKTGKLEYKIPQTFDPSTAPLSYASLAFQDSADNHYSACIPSSTKITVHKGYDTSHNPLFGGVTHGISHYLKRPLSSAPPILHLHITTFSDKTFIGITLPHVVNDASGMGEIIRAWIACLNSGPDGVPALTQGFDPIAHLSTDPKYADLGSAKMPQGYAVMSGWNLFKFAIGFVWQLISDRGEVSYRFHIPPSELKRMHREAQQELDAKTAASSSTEEEKATPSFDADNLPNKVSELDVLQAWIMKIMFSSSQRPNALISASFACNMRPRFPEIFSPPNASSSSSPIRTSAPYIHNAALSLVLHPRLTTFQIQQMPLSTLASHVRLTILQTTSKESLASTAKFLAASPDLSIAPFLVDGESQFMVASSWRRVGIVGSSFESALVENEIGTKGSGKVERLMPIATVNLPKRRLCMITDASDGGAWVELCLPTKHWGRGDLGKMLAEQP